MIALLAALAVSLAPVGFDCDSSPGEGRWCTAKVAIGPTVHRVWGGYSPSGIWQTRRDSYPRQSY